MGFLASAAGSLLGGVFGKTLFKAILGKKKAKQEQLAPSRVTRDQAQIDAEREKEIARRRGARADRTTGSGGEPAGGLGSMVVGS